MRRAWIATLTCGVMLGCNDPPTTDVGIAVTVQNVIAAHVDQIELCVFDDARAEPCVTRPAVAGGILTRDQVLIPIVLHGAPDNKGVTVRARGLMSSAPVDSASSTVVLHRRQYTPVTIDFNGPPCDDTSACDGTDNNCNDLVDDGCCMAGTWDFETVDGDDFARQPSIALQGTQPRVVYNDGTNLRYAARDNGQWNVNSNFATVATDGQIPRLDFDAEGRAHIMSLVDDTNFEKVLVHHFQTSPGGAFSSKTWDVNAQPTDALSFQIDRVHDELHVAYISENLQKVVYQTAPVNSTAVPAAEMIDAAFMAPPTALSLALSPSGVPSILIADNSSGTEFVSYRTRVNESWATNGSATSVSNVIGSISAKMISETEIAAIASHTGPAVANFLDVDYDGSTWTSDEPLPAGSNRGDQPSLDIDQFGTKHVMLQSVGASPKTLEYACKSAALGTWTYQTIKSDGLTLSDRALAVSDDQCVQVVYELDSGSGIEYARHMLTVYRDADDDGYGDASMPLSSCSVPIGYVANQNDCDDSNNNVHPRALEICGDGIDQDCSGADLACPP